MRLKGWAAIAVLTLMAACGARESEPVSFVRALYAPYIANDNAKIGLEHAGLTADLKAMVDKADAYGRLLDEPIIDYDPIANGQDWEIKSVAVAAPTPPKDGAATVVATFNNGADPQTVTYALREEDGDWKIDDITSGGQSFRAGIESNLRPAGDPTAMEAPVRALYVRYAAETRPEPLHRWAALSAALKPAMEAAAAMGKRSDNPVLDFDPVLGGSENRIGIVSYEAASSAVIARFQNGDTAKIIVFDLTQENGAWKIANIRSPGEWDLLQKLNAAGVTGEQITSEPKK